MPIGIGTQVPPTNGVITDLNAFYTVQMVQQENEFWGPMRFQWTLPDATNVNIIFGDVTEGVNFAPGWEGIVNGVDLNTLDITFRPVGGWTVGNYGAPTPFLGRLTLVEVASAGFPRQEYQQAAPQWDFTVVAPGGGELLVDGSRRFDLPTSCFVSASGATGRRNGIVSAARTGAGVYAITFEPGRARELAEYDVRAVPVGAAARVAVVDPAGGVFTVRTFDAAGAPADTAFLLAFERS